jgi:hypothetical protein
MEMQKNRTISLLNSTMFVSWIQAFKEGDVPETLMSQDTHIMKHHVRNLYSDWAKPPAPELDMYKMIEQQDKVRVQIAVGSTFRSIVEESEEEVLLIILKKQCSWCM